MSIYLPVINLSLTVRRSCIGCEKTLRSTPEPVIMSHHSVSLRSDAETPWVLRYTPRVLHQCEGKIWFRP